MGVDKGAYQQEQSSILRTALPAINTAMRLSTRWRGRPLYPTRLPKLVHSPRNKQRARIHKDASAVSLPIKRERASVPAVFAQKKKKTQKRYLWGAKQWYPHKYN
ncbi:hypothetical protein A2671_00475 [Candidatus Kaiserbacteria bacterium RIFCSPHIGHO2_01_FULL_49_13]|uniref:Uncharacterized protein n=1 Tax=Candidatus Kaiserbacteria bacterium RIFCSPHIGHO2_01_FULL_49_13 TaxID=1798477 RepID=A0A1F6CCN1_9BACT|nr:MAG: hypothetical protein A2671_00475 [Candidatus Kaiserbacteria bacterium RIFCSPHIGHO2_01_FULL_49_13]